jgi:MFS family permease
MERELMEGNRHLWDEPLTGIVVVAGAIFVFAPATVLTLGIAFAQSALHSGSAGYGEILAGLGVGSLLGAIWMIGFRARWPEETVFALSGVLLGVGVAVLGAAHTVLIAAAAYGVAGFGSMASTVAGVTLLQRLVPDRLRGRIFAVSSTFDHLGAFASTLVIGGGAVAVGAAALISLSGVVAAVTGAASLLLIHRYRPGARTS